MRAGAPGEPPGGNLVDKASMWLRRANDDSSVDAFSILGAVLEEFMDVEAVTPDCIAKRERIQGVLARFGLSYQSGGRIVDAAAGAPSRTLETVIRERDLVALEVELSRALNTVNSDPAAAATAACAIIESLCKVYIEDEHLEMPVDQSVKPLWRVVQRHLELDPASMAHQDMRKILGGLASIVDGVGSLRTHAGSAHGHGRDHFPLESRHARLAINAAHTLVVFVIETWEIRRSSC
jgi:hypothetical protein